MRNILTIFMIAAVAYAVLPEINAQQPEEICNEESIQIK